jgi:D-xylonolactonase
MSLQIELLANEHNRCGENPLWDDRRDVLFWVDIPPGKLFAWDRATGTHRLVIEYGRECGAFTLQENGDLLLFFTDEMARLNPDTGELTTLKTGIAPDTGRFNDCLADPKGRVFAGTVDFGTGKKRGGIHRILPDGSTTELWRGTECANGWSFTPDMKGVYWCDTTAQHLVRYDYDVETGELANRRIFLETPGHSPDGFTIDREGNLWVAMWNTGSLRYYSPEAELLDEIDLPSKHATACIFGGPDLDELYITTAGGSPEATDGSGALYRVKPKISGRPEYRSRILI